MCRNAAVCLNDRMNTSLASFLRRTTVVAALAVVGSSTLSSVPSVQAAEATTVAATGVVSCERGKPLVAVDIETTDGFTKRATIEQFGTNQSKGEFSVRIPRSDGERARLKALCGRYEDGSVYSVNFTPWSAPMKASLLTDGALRLDALCTEAAGPQAVRCAWPAKPNLASQGKFDAGYCTAYAATRWAAFTGKNPTWSGDAHEWDQNAKAHGWTVVNFPVPNSVVVWEISDSYGGWGHVAFVESIDVRSDGVYLTVSEMNFEGWNVKSTRVVKHGAGMDYVVTPLW